MAEKLYKIAVSLVDELIERRSEQLRYHEDKSLMIMPKYFFTEFRKGLMQGPGNSMGIGDFMSNNLKYRNLKVLIGYENKVVIYHENYPETMDENFKVELDLSHVNERQLPAGYEFTDEPKQLK